jgi:exopolysaccharide biosynthesis polyprenyl glycosylphosphotransferase
MSTPAQWAAVDPRAATNPGSTSTIEAPRPRLRAAERADADAPRSPGVRRSVTGGPRWSRAFSRYLLLNDLVVVLWAVAGGYIYRFGLQQFVSLPTEGVASRVSYLSVAVAVVVAWVAALALQDTRSVRIIGVGPDEYKRVVAASFQVFGVVAIASYVLNLSLARGFIVFAFPVGTMALLLSRWMWRQWLITVRRNQRYCSRVVVVGGEDHVEHLVDELDRNRAAGYRVIAASAGGPDGQPAGVLASGDPRLVARTAIDLRADAVLVTSGPGFGPKALRQIAWGLENTDIELIVAPSLTDVAGPRVHHRPVPGLPLLHVEVPRYEGPSRVVKNLLERAICVVALMLLSPVFAAIAVLVKRSSRGPVFYRQERIGKDGRPFRMTKFRSMVTDADLLLIDLRSSNEAQGPLFKVRADPRVTPIGRVLRRYSLDELPQLLDVVRGSMSLVGPRPPLPSEVAVYGRDDHRRLLVKPGITGLWQVSGRSDLSWEDSVRLDLYYVENWSFTGDLAILARTLKAVLGGSGAY